MQANQYIELETDLPLAQGIKFDLKEKYVYTSNNVRKILARNILADGFERSRFRKKS